MHAIFNASRMHTVNFITYLLIFIETSVNVSKTHTKIDRINAGQRRELMATLTNRLDFPTSPPAICLRPRPEIVLLTVMIWRWRNCHGIAKLSSHHRKDIRHFCVSHKVYNAAPNSASPSRTRNIGIIAHIDAVCARLYL